MVKAIDLAKALFKALGLSFYQRGQRRFKLRMSGSLGSNMKEIALNYPILDFGIEEI